MATTKKEIVSLRAFEARMRRHYLKTEEWELCKRRGKAAETKGDYYLVSGRTIAAEFALPDMVKAAVESGNLKPYEAIQFNNESALYCEQVDGSCVVKLLKLDG